MTTQDAEFIENNLSEVVARIQELTTNMLGADLVDVYFYLTGKNDIVNYGFSRDSGTIMTLTSQSQHFYKYDCEGYVDDTSIELELEQNIAQAIY